MLCFCIYDVFHLIKEIWTYTPQFTYTLDSVMYKLKVDKSYKHSRNTRHPKTIQELRFNCAHNKYIRGKRHNLPTWCDELPVKIIHSKSWKNRTKHKKTMDATICTKLKNLLGYGVLNPFYLRGLVCVLAREIILPILQHFKRRREYYGY